MFKDKSRSNMTVEEAKYYLQTRQLSDYKESWPNKQKGCLFFINSDSRQYLCLECYLKIIDFPWRKGASWKDYPKLLPYEKREIASPVDKIFQFKLSHFGAFLLAYIIENGIPSDSDLHILWDTYLQQYSKIYSNPVVFEYIHYSYFFSRQKKYISQIIDTLNLSLTNGQPLIDSFLKSWQSAISFWLDKYISEMTTQRQLFEWDMCFKVDGSCSFDVPVRVYDQAKTECDEEATIVRCDEDEYFEEGTETYTVDEVRLSYNKSFNALVLECAVPEAYERKAIEFEYDAEDETFVAIDFEENFSSDEDTVIESIGVCGLTAFVLGYSAIGMIMQAYQSHNKWSALSKLVNDSDNWHIKDIKIYITQSVYDTYFENFCERYENEHKTDSDFIVIRGNNKTILLLEEAIKSEQENIKKSLLIDHYLTKEQAAQLHKDVNNYITYLKDRLSELKPTQTIRNYSQVVSELQITSPRKFQYIKSDDTDEIKIIEDTMAIYIRGNQPSELCRYLFYNVGKLFLEMPARAETMHDCIVARWGDENQIKKTGLKVAWKRHRPKSK